jgi:hypothetical protein
LHADRPIAVRHDTIEFGTADDTIVDIVTTRSATMRLYRRFATQFVQDAEVNEADRTRSKRRYGP